MKKIAVKLTLTFTALIIISTVLSFVTAVLLTPELRHEIRRSQEAIATTIIELSNKTNLSSEEIAEIVSGFMYDVRVIDAPDIPQSDNLEIMELEDSRVQVFSQGKWGSTRTFLVSENAVYQIRLQPHNTIVKMTASRNWYSFLSFVFIGALLMMMMARRIVKPVLRLTEATREISRGNFNVQVDYNSDDEVGQLTAHFNTMARELQHIDTLRKDFISNVSHEFKTPIASIQGFSKLLVQNNLSEEERRDYLNIIAEESTRLSHLSTNMIRLSKLESQEIVHRCETFSLDEQLRKSILLLEPEWSQKQVQWDIDLDRAVLAGDEELLQQVWINLLNNAIKFSASGQTIAVSLTHTREGVSVKIIDEGIGMDEDVQAHIFEKFFQGDTSHASEGSGLGLTLVKRIVDLHQGTVEVTSVPGEGTTIHVSLPMGNP